jgi:hypothetical protein
MVVVSGAMKLLGAWRAVVAAVSLVASSCGPAITAPDEIDPEDPGNLPGPPLDPGNPEPGCVSGTECYAVFAHSDHVLYQIDLRTNSLALVGKFNAPKVMVGTQLLEDVITDLAVAPDRTVYVASAGYLYTADRTDGHVTRKGPLAACGEKAVALSFTVTGKLYTADFKGAFCRVDLTTSPVTVLKVGQLDSGMAVSGDLVAVSDGTMFATAYKLSDAAGSGTQLTTCWSRSTRSRGSSPRPWARPAIPSCSASPSPRARCSASRTTAPVA